MLEIIEKFSSAKVLVIGDVMLDEYIWGEVERISPEAPVPVVRTINNTYHLGGASNVVNNICALGGRGLIVGVIGGDPQARALQKLLSSKNIPLDGLIQFHDIPTTHKLRVMAQHQQLIRIDHEASHNDRIEMTKQIIEKVKTLINDVDAVVISDYGKGVISRKLVENVIKFIKKRDIKVVVDPKSEHFNLYQNVDAITPNNFEASAASGIRVRKDEDLLEVGKKLLQMTNAKSVVITRGEKGMSIFRVGKKPYHIPTVAKEVFDVSGAGDTVIATMSLALAGGADIIMASKIANQAAGIVVGKLGVATVSQEELINAFANKPK